MTLATLALIVLALGLIGLIASVSLMVNAKRGRPAVEVAAGLEVLRSLPWKEFAALVVRAFEQRSFKSEAGAKQRKPGDDGIDFLLERLGQRHVLQIKHGGSLQVGAAPVRRLAQLLATHNAQAGVLVTSGQFDASAREATRGQSVTLLDGEALWTQLKSLVPATMAAEARARADEVEKKTRSRYGLAAIVSMAVAVLGVGASVQERMQPSAGDDVAAAVAPAATPAAAAPAAATATTPAPAARTPRKAPATEAELAQQRDFTAASALLVNGVVSATWPTKSTLLVAVRAGDSIKRADIIAGICEILLKREELRFTRLQIHDFNSGDTGAGVHWMQCK